MARYRMAEGHKHWIYGQLFKGKDLDGRTEGDMLELTEQQASRIEHKLEGGPLFTPSKGGADGIPAPLVPAMPPTSKDVHSFDTENAPEESTIKDPSVENSKPELRHLGKGLWNVVRNEVSMNDVPITLDEAKSMIAGMEN